MTRRRDTWQGTECSKAEQRESMVRWLGQAEAVEGLILSGGCATENAPLTRRMIRPVTNVRLAQKQVEKGWGTLVLNAVSLIAVKMRGADQVR